MKTSFRLLLLAFLATGCGPQPTLPRGEPHHLSSGIVGGTVDNGHDAVAIIVNTQQGYICTGTLIDYRVILTAAHCVEDTNASHYQVGGGTDPFGVGADWVENAVEVAAHPSYDPQTIGVRDVGIVVLAGDPPVAPIAWQKTVDNGVYTIGTPFTAVGYGITSGQAQDSGVKRTVDLQVTDLGSDAFAYGSASGNTCSGDSGGPALRTIGGQETVIGVVSYGDQDCAQYGVDMRTDYNATFISQYATGTGPGPTPTPSGTPTPGPNPTNPAEEDEGYGLFGCSVANGTSPLPLLPLGLAFAVFFLRRRD